MKNVKIVLGTVVFVMVTLTACKKEECHECHYEDASGAEVELGEKCGDELESLEASGYNTGGTNYEVHCHEH